MAGSVSWHMRWRKPLPRPGLNDFGELLHDAYVCQEQINPDVAMGTIADTLYAEASETVLLAASCLGPVAAATDESIAIKNAPSAGGSAGKGHAGSRHGFHVRHRGCRSGEARIAEPGRRRRKERGRRRRIDSGRRPGHRAARCVAGYPQGPGPCVRPPLSELPARSTSLRRYPRRRAVHWLSRRPGLRRFRSALP